MQAQNSQPCLEVNELRNMMKEPEANLLIVDVRMQEDFAAQHVPGAIHIPLNELGSRLDELPKNALIITVCTKGGGRSVQGAELLQENGYIHAISLCGGTMGWFAAK